MIRKIAFLAALGLVFAASHAQAGFNGTLTVSAPAPTLNTGDLSTATTFTLGSTSVTAGTGDLSGVPTSTTFTGTAFNYPVPPNPSSSMTFSNTSYGTFTQTSQATDSFLSSNGLVVATYDIGGEFSTGTINSTVDGGAVNEQARLVVTLVQVTVGGDKVLSGTAVLAVGAVAVAEPASVAMVGIGVAGIGGYSVWRRRKAQNRAASLA